MAEIVVTCPGCSHKFKVTGSDEVLRKEMFVCSNCGLQAPFSAVQDWSSMFHGKNKQKTQKSSPKENSSQVSGFQDERHTMVTGRYVHAGQLAFLVIPDINRRIELHSGAFVLGRQSSDSKADIKLAPDPYMSRDHALLEVSLMNGRQSFKIKALKDNNPVYINNSMIRPSDVVLLQPGDIIVMGRTKIVFET